MNIERSLIELMKSGRTISYLRIVIEKNFRKITDRIFLI